MCLSNLVTYGRHPDIPWLLDKYNTETLGIYCQQGRNELLCGYFWMCVCVWPEINTEESQTWWKTANFLHTDTSPTFKQTKPQKLDWNLLSLGWVLTLCSQAADSRFQLLQESPGATVTQILWLRRSQSSSLPRQKHLHRAGSFGGVP